MLSNQQKDFALMAGLIKGEEATGKALAKALFGQLKLADKPLEQSHPIVDR
jgi:hypothetical protein